MSVDREKGLFRRILPSAVLGLACVALSFLPGADLLTEPDDRPTVLATVVETDDSDIQLHGLVEFGTQHLRVRLPDGTEKAACNELRAQLEFDKKFVVGDTAVVVDGEEPVLARDHWRLGWAGVLFAAFAVLICLFGGWTGLQALLSFVFSCLAVWKVLIPACLGGWHAAWTSFAVVTLLTGVIMYLVAGWTRKAAAACAGAVLGVVSSLGLSAFFTVAMHVNGATMPFVQTLLYSGCSELNLADLFTGAVILGSSGAVMDLAMDIAAGVAEVARHNPTLTRRALFMSGIRIGRSVVGTMTTTLLLAYSGGYLTLLMVFAAQGTPPADYLNSTLVSAELVRTLVGSFGLVLVAPFTALVSAMLFDSAKVRQSGNAHEF